ncbi:hypothetical protein [Porphyrobacter sp. YT40]|uniref:hypothetical protein n=1 Tax=Porphyrobacter sp. YT40 TaxID=2547601 RepID=UPI0011443AF9|nr:hypothetical protein [Porphyrobacter sp. YT40]QDH35790.1 hypothetical protein E2E27_16605 [Porphyrobacter sp. YT40]
MAGIKRPKRSKRAADTAPAADAPAPAEGSGKTKGSGRLPLPSPVTGTNLVIADIVLRAASSMLRNRMEKGLVVRSYGRSEKGHAKAEKLVDKRGLASSIALWGASSLARRSPMGLAVVAGGLAAKVFYDRGKRLEAQRRARKAAGKPSADSES